MKNLIDWSQKLCFVDRTSLYNLVNKNQLGSQFILTIFINLYIFRADLCTSFREKIVFLRHLVIVIVCGWLSGMLNREYLISDPARYRYARYKPDSTWALIQLVPVMHGTYHTVPDLWSTPLPLCTVHTIQYLTSDPARYRYTRHIPDSTWHLLSHLPLCTVNTRQYLTSDPARYRYARYIPDSTWPLTQPVTVMHGTYQTVPDLWSSPLPLSCFNCACLQKAVGPSH